MTGNIDKLIEEIKQQLSQMFEMKYLREQHYCLGLEVWRDSGQNFLSQGKYVKSLLNKFEMDLCKVAFVPLQQNNKLQVNDGNLDDRRSIIGYTFNIGSGVISWCGKKQHNVALSSLEAEYQAMCATVCEAIWLGRLPQDAGEEKTEATVIKCDNQSSIKLSYNLVFHKSTNHIDTQFHFVMEKV
eukprot:PITA_24291